MNALPGLTHAPQRHERSCFGNTWSGCSPVLYNLATLFLLLSFLSALRKRTHPTPYGETSSCTSTLAVADQDEGNSCCDPSPLAPLGYRQRSCPARPQGSPGLTHAGSMSALQSFRFRPSNKSAPSTRLKDSRSIGPPARGDFYATVKMNMLCRNKNSAGPEVAAAPLSAQAKKSTRGIVSLTVPKIVGAHVQLLLKTGAAQSILAPGSNVL